MPADTVTPIRPDTGTGGAYSAPALEVAGLSVLYNTDQGALPAVEDVSLSVKAGKTLGVVGESGCGKSTLALALLGLVQPPGHITRGQVRLQGTDILSIPDRALRDIRGNRISIIFQEPMTALNPVFTVGDQIAEVLQIHRAMPRHAAWDAALSALARVQIPDPATRARAYPHQLSGGMRQRAMIAMALACEPDVLVADEATTALDVTIQAQIIDLLLRLQDETGMAMLFISHNLGVVSQVADDIVVMYGGRIVERAPAMGLFAHPRHPYTQGLLDTLPRPDRRGRRLPAIGGSVPDLRHDVRGCLFAPRCLLADDHCRQAAPAMVGGVHAAACFKATL